MRILVAVVLLLVGSAAWADSLEISNPGFEQGKDALADDWTWWSRTDHGSAVRTDEQANVGKSAARVTHDGPRDWAFASESRMAVEPGRYYRATAMVRVERGSVELACVGYAGGKWVTWDIGSGTVGSGDGWQQVKALAEVPDGVDQVGLRFVGSGDTLAWIDDVRITEWDWQRKDKPKVTGYAAARVTEPLDRGLVVDALPGHGAYLSWRLLSSDPADAAFNVYRQRTGQTPERINPEPIRLTTDFLFMATDAESGDYFVRSINADGQGEPSAAVCPKIADSFPLYRSIKLDDGVTFRSVGMADLDGDGRYDFVIKQPGDNIDPYDKYWSRSPDTYTLEAYDHDGKLLWKYDLGWAIERGTWYSPYLVYDLDGDGRAEVIAKTGEGDPRDEDGRVRTGKEYVTILDGQTGKVRTQAAWPSRDGFEGERGYNYWSRNQLAVAYLDGKTPCLIVERGTYNLMKAVAYQFTGSRLEELWTWDNAEMPRSYWGQGAHWMHAADVDADGRDEVVLGSSVLDDNGACLWTTGLGHPDHAYVGDLDPNRPGLEIYYGMETRQENNGMCMVDAATGKILWGHQGKTRHVHSYGMCSDIDAASPGSECYSADTDADKKALWARLHAADGTVLSEEMPWGFGPRTVYWDADPQRELLTSRVFNYGTGDVLQQIEGRVIAVADLMGDWREEIITSVAGELRIYRTMIPATDRRVCLMQDPLYRMDVAVSTMGYYQVPMLSYDMASEE